MKLRRNLLWLGVCFTLLLARGPVQAYALSGKEIMEKVKATRVWENEVAQVSFLIINKDKKTRLRHVLRRRKNYAGKDGLDTKTLMVFQHPPGYDNYAYLGWSYRKSGQRALTWVYNPKDTFLVKPVRRLVYNQRDNFLGFWLQGNDFTYEDLIERPVEADSHTLLRKEVYNLKPCYIVESKPRHKQDNNTAKRIFWIWKDKWLPLKVDFYDSQSNLRKTLYNHWAQVQGFWTLKQSLMKNHNTQHQTIMRVDKVEYNTKSSDIYFTPSFLGLR